MYNVFVNGVEQHVEDDSWAKFCSRYVVVNAAGGLVKNDQNDYLMIFRNGVWDLPKGKCEAGESYEQTALREVREECGVEDTLQLRGLLTVTYHTYALQGVDVLKRILWYAMTCPADSFSLTPQTEEGIEIAEFVPAAELLARMDATYPSVRTVVAAEFAGK
ncbi:MAG: NUDIX domain-containing protein [Prevotellaceae bacterium]|jgi:8-oxo-dGTP pyrophosphatase MutT (NUDIX family)|nr:NUDIX domain-containing protein [Prevotellaceae bacterium]